MNEFILLIFLYLLFLLLSLLFAYRSVRFTKTQTTIYLVLYFFSSYFYYGLIVSSYQYLVELRKTTLDFGHAYIELVVLFFACSFTEIVIIIVVIKKRRKMLTIVKQEKI